MAEQFLFWYFVLSNIKYVFYRNTSILLIDNNLCDTKRCITYICDTRCTLVGTTFMTS